jgi:type II secretory pathway component PulL
MANQSQRWFDLRRDQLGPADPLRPIQTQLRLVTLAAAACLLAVVVGGWWRTQRIEKEITSVRSQQRQLFQEAFPDAKVPGALLRRVRSEHVRVMGSRGASSQVDVPQSATEVLRELLAALPENVQFRITSVDILNGQVDLDLQVRSPVDAGELATSLSSAGFEVKPPVTTQKDAKTFDSLLEAQWSGRSENPALQDEVSVRISIGGEITG